MSAGPEFSGIGKIQILCYEKAALCVTGIPEFSIGTPVQSFIKYRMDIMPQALQLLRQLERKIFIDLDFHAANLGEGRSSRVDAAAKAITARRASIDTPGKSFSIASNESPASSDARIVLKGTRVPLITGVPPQIA
jgi:hypothetical protein